MKPILCLTVFTFAAVLCPCTARGQTTAAEVWVQRYGAASDSNNQATKVVTDGSGNVIVAGYTDEGITGTDMLVIKYSTAGMALWTNRYNGPGNGDDYAYALAVDGNENVFVTGYSASDYSTIAYSGAGVALWTNRYSGPGNNDDSASAMAVDGDGNVFVTGSSGTTNGYSDYATIAYSGAGLTLWTNRYNALGNSYDHAQAVAVDGSGNVFVTGSSGGNGSPTDYVTIAYSGTGVALWTNRYNGLANGNDSASAVAVDGSGNVFVTGYSAGNGSASDYATIAYSGAGVALWTNRYNGPANGNDSASAVAVDGSGNVFVTGSSDGDGGASDYATIAYTAAGVALWTNHYSGPGNSDAYTSALAVDGSGNVFITGLSFGNGSSADYATIAYSGAGVALWTNHYNGPGNSDDRAFALAVDGSGNVYITGLSTGYGSTQDYATIAYSPAGLALWTNRYNGLGNGSDQAEAVAVGGSVFVTGSSVGTNGYSDYATIAYSLAGVALWTNRYNGPGNSDDKASALAVGGIGNVFVTGSSGGNGSPYDYATVAYSGAGVALWTNRYNGPGNSSDNASALAVDGSGNVFVTGSSIGTNGYSDFATVAYSGSGVALWTNRYHGSVNNADRAQAVAVDGTGNVFVTGSSGGNGSALDYATIAYSGAGVALWTNRYNGLGNRDDQASAVAVDGNGKVFVTGFSASISAFPYNNDYATIAYSGSGVALWTNRYNGPGNGTDQAQALAVDVSGNVFVTGYSAGNGSSFDYATIAYSPAGVALWTNRYNGPGNGSDQAQAVAVDGSGNVFVTGYSAGNGSASDYATIAYSGAGVALWTNRYNGPANGGDSPRTKQSLAAGPDGGVYVTGASGGDYAGFGPTDFATIKYVTVLSLSAVLSNNVLVVAWPQWTPPWRLEVQTNSLSVGVNTNWMSVSGSTATNWMEFPVLDGADTALFRLVAP